MARKFWERLSATRIQFYDEPLDLRRDAVDARILELQETLALPDHLKAVLAASMSNVSTEDEFNALFQGEIDVLADQRDYFDSQELVVESIDVIDHRWMSPADMALGAGTIVSVCGEEAGNEAINAIDGAGGTNWQHDVDEAHELVFDLGYKKRIDGLRVKNPATPGVPLQLSGVNVFIANTIGGLDNPANHVGVDLEFTDPNDNDRDLTPAGGRYVKITVASTGHASNHITVRELELRTRPRTFGL